MQSGFSIGKLPQPVTFGLNVPFNNLVKFGQLILNGAGVEEARKEAYIGKGTAYIFLKRTGLRRPDCSCGRKGGHLGRCKTRFDKVINVRRGKNGKFI